MYRLLQWGQATWIYSIVVLLFLCSFYLLIVSGLPPDHPLVKFLSVLPLGTYYQMQKVAYSSVTGALSGPLAGILSVLTNAKIVINLIILGLTGLGAICFKAITLVPVLSPLLIPLGVFLTFLQFTGYLYIIYCIILRQC